MRKIPIALLLIGMVTALFAADHYIPVGAIDQDPGHFYLKWDDGTRFEKNGYPSLDQGWGVKFCPGTEQRWWKIDQIQVTLCPPPPGDDGYKEEVRIYLPDGPDHSPGTLIWRKEYDVRIGEWWHYIDVDDVDLWVEGCFYAFSVTTSGYQSLYQWFDPTDDAPTGSQWYYNGSTFSPYVDATCGDVEIRAIVETHNVAAGNIVVPTGALNFGATFTPSATVLNYEPFPETDVPVRLWIVSADDPSLVVYDQWTTTDFPANSTPFVVTFPGDIANYGIGNYIVYVQTYLPHDWDNSNDQASADLEIVYRDIAVEEIEFPVGNIPLGTDVTPLVHVTNNSTFLATFPLSLSWAGYTRTISVEDMYPGEHRVVSFPIWNASPVGPYTATTVASYPGDMDPSNDMATMPFQVVTYEKDVGAVVVLSPTGTINTEQYLPLTVRVKNFGTAAQSFYVRCTLITPAPVSKTVYSQYITLLAPGATIDMVMTTRYYRQTGTWSARAATFLVGDANTANNYCTGSFNVIPGAHGWNASAPLPSGTTIDRGAAIASDGNETYYLLTGKKTPGLYTYAPEAGEQVTNLPDEVGTKLGLGSSIAYTAGNVYLLVGNKTSEFYAADMTSGAWNRLADMPLGVSQKPARAGGAMTVLNGRIYAVKGNGTDEFYVFDPLTDGWRTLSPVPMGSGKTVKDGAALANNGSRIFIVKGGSKEFYTYNPADGAWQKLADLPKKAKAGASLSYLNGVLFATIGGTNEFYAYDMNTNVWARLENVPLAPDYKKATSGASMTSLASSLVYMKGRKCGTVFTYYPEAEVFAKSTPTENVAGSAVSAAERWVINNPVRSSVRIPVNGDARVRLFTSAGTMVRSLDASKPVELDVSGLANGIYLLKVTQNDVTTSHSVVVEH